MNDELFDDLMRNKLNGLQPEFNEQAWNDLESRLDQHHKQLGKQVFLRRMMRVAAMLLGAGVLYGLSYTFIPSDTQLSTTNAQKEEIQTQTFSKKENNITKKSQKEEKSTTEKDRLATTEPHLSNTLSTTDETKNLQKITSDNAKTETVATSQIKQNTDFPLSKRYSEKMYSENDEILGSNTSPSAHTQANPQVLHTNLAKIEGIAVLKHTLTQPKSMKLAVLPSISADDEALIYAYFKKKSGLRIGLGASAEVSKAAGSGKMNGAWNGVASILLEKNIQKNWRVGVGLSYLQRFQNNNIDPNPSVATQIVEVSEQTRINQLTIEKERGTFTERLEMPIELKLMIGNHHRWRGFLASGLVLGLNLKEKDIFESENVFINSDTGERIGSSNVFRKTDSRFSGNVDWQINAGLEYSLNSNFHLQLMPYYRYALSNTQAEQIGNQTFGLRSVIYYSW